jgi:hypothetical protein
MAISVLALNGRNKPKYLTLILCFNQFPVVFRVMKIKHFCDPIREGKQVVLAFMKRDIGNIYCKMQLKIIRFVALDIIPRISEKKETISIRFQIA